MYLSDSITKLLIDSLSEIEDDIDAISDLYDKDESPRKLAFISGRLFAIRRLLQREHAGAQGA